MLIFDIALICLIGYNKNPFQCPKTRVKGHRKAKKAHFKAKKACFKALSGQPGKIKRRSPQPTKAPGNGNHPQQAAYVL
jgi:hypothetical protein